MLDDPYKALAFLDGLQRREGDDLRSTCGTCGVGARAPRPVAFRGHARPEGALAPGPERSGRASRAAKVGSRARLPRGGGIGSGGPGAIPTRSLDSLTTPRPRESLDTTGERQATSLSGCAVACLPLVPFPTLYAACVVLCEGSDYEINRREEVPEAGVARCVITDPINRGLDEVTQASPPLCRPSSSVPVPGAEGLAEWARSAPLLTDVEPGTYRRTLPAAYAARYPSAQYPFDNPIAEWLYLRGLSDPGRVGWVSTGEPDPLLAVGMVPFLLFELLSEGELVTDSGAVRPQMQFRFWVGMIISTQNLDDTTEVSRGVDEGGRMIEFMTHIEATTARIRTFRADGADFVGHDMIRTYSCDSVSSWTEMIVPETSTTRPANAFRARDEGVSSVIGMITRGDVQITGNSRDSLTDPAFRDFALREAFSCLIGEKVEFQYAVSFLTGELDPRTDEPLSTTAMMARCLTFDDVRDVCDFLAEYDALQDVPAGGHFVFQSHDEGNLRANTETC